MRKGSPEAASTLVDILRDLLHVAFVPMPDAVARLDISEHDWILYLDSDSPAEDHCWAMLDVLSVLTNGRDAAEWAVPGRWLHVVHD
jgi:hypothetical protein